MDLGLHKGEDTEFYLRKGFRVLGVDANSELCADASQRLSSYIRSGRLTVLNRAIAEQRGRVTFYKSAQSEWGTLQPDWVKRNSRLGVQITEQVEVEAVTLAELI